jgi:hypothetical protein
MKRRNFIALLGGAAVWPLAARAQQGERVRRIGSLQGIAADNPAAQSFIDAFTSRLQERHPGPQHQGGVMPIRCRYSITSRSANDDNDRCWHLCDMP